MTTYRLVYETYVEAEDLWEAVKKAKKFDDLELIGCGEDRFSMDEMFAGE